MIGVLPLILATTWNAFSPATTSGSPAEVAAAFWKRDLGGARMQLERVVLHLPVEPQHEPGGPEHFWQELFDLADCKPLEVGQELPHVPANEWEILTGLVRLERLRHRRVRGEALLAGLHTDLLQPKFFQRGDKDKVPTDAILWPVNQELWDDEMVQATPQASLCTRGAAPSGKQAQKWFDEELALLKAMQRAVPSGHPSWAALRLEEAALLFKQGALPKALEAARPLYENAPPGLTEAETDQAALLHAMALEQAGDQEAALGLYAKVAGSAGLNRQQAFIQSRREWALAAMNHYEDLLKVLPDLPNLASPVGRYEAYLKARSLLAVQRYDGLLDHARQTLRRATEAEAQTPELGYLNDEVYEYLVTVPFEDRVIEIVESLGPPRLLYQRLERLAQVASQSSQYDEAKAALNWLLIHHKSGPHQGRYRAMLAEVAFDAGDLVGFPVLLRELTAPNEQLLKIIPSARRGQFFEERDRQLLRVVAHAVPRLAERNDDRWTGPLTKILQQFLEDSPESRVAVPLTEMYRTARSLLGKGAKMYAERIGDRKPSIVLGEVELPRLKLQLAPPQVAPRIDEPTSLLRIPTGGESTPVRGWFDGMGGT